MSVVRCPLHRGLLPRSATACRPNGSRTRPRGFRGRISWQSWPGKFEPIPPFRPGWFARWQNASQCISWPAGDCRRRLKYSSARCQTSRCTKSRPTMPGSAITARCFSSGRPLRRRRWSIGATTPGAASIRLTKTTTRSRGSSPRSLATCASSRGSSGRGRDRHQRPRHVLTTEQCLLNPNRNPQLATARDRALSGRLSAVPAKCSGSAAESSATTPTDISTSWPASSGRARSWPPSRTIRRTRIIGRCRRILRGCKVMTDADDAAAGGHSAADAAADVSRRAAAAGQLSAISTSPTAWSSCRSSTIRPTPASWKSSGRCFRAARSARCRPAIWFGAWGRFTALRSSSRAQPMIESLVGNALRGVPALRTATSIGSARNVTEDVPYSRPMATLRLKDYFGHAPFTKLRGASLAGSSTTWRIFCRFQV